MKAYIQFSKNNITYPMLNKYIEFNTKKQLINKIRKSQTKDNLRRFFGSYTSINIDVYHEETFFYKGTINI